MVNGHNHDERTSDPLELDHTVTLSSGITIKPFGFAVITGIIGKSYEPLAGTPIRVMTRAMHPGDGKIPPRIGCAEYLQRHQEG